MRLGEKNIIIIGALGLLGKNFCNAVLHEGANLLLVDINEEIGKNFGDNLSEKFPKSQIYYSNANINNRDSLLNLFSVAKNYFGSVDSIVNTAYPRNKNYGRKLFDVEYEDFCENLSLNLGGYFLVTQVASEFFIKQGYGNIINISSIYGVIAPKFEVYDNTTMTMPVEYAVIKSGLIHLTKYFAKYLKSKNIRINCISPGGIFDNQSKEFIQEYKKLCINKGMLNAEDIIGGLIFLLSTESEFINGQNLIIDDGFTI